MRKIKIAINGFGRIGRLAFRNLIEDEGVEVVAINDLTDPDMLAHLLKYDSVQGAFQGDVQLRSQALQVNGKSIHCFAERNPADLPWKVLEVDLVLECTGQFLTREKAHAHIKAGAKRVLLSAPAKSSGVPTIVRGVNDHLIESDDWLFSNASCTTNCLAPIMKVLDEHYDFQSAFMTTIHAYTANQNILDGPHKDKRRARAAALNIIPTSTGAAKALALVLPQLAGKLEAAAIRVPVPTGSMIELTATFGQKMDKNELNRKMKEASENELKGILEYTEAPLVSSDIVSSPYSSIYDAELTAVVGNQVKITAWYDNESGYAKRLAELSKELALVLSQHAV
jgi:glyceraldehyde 3-phosphate dehydrogenase